jgi:hypothetical protein
MGMRMRMRMRIKLENLLFRSMWETLLRAFSNP